MKLIKLSIIPVLCVLLAGCFSAVSLQQKQLYILNPSKLTLKKYPTSHKSLLVMNTQANDAIDNKKMAYVKQPYQLAYFSKHAWAAEPADQLTTLIAAALRQTHFFKAVVITPFVGITNLKLSTHLNKLQQNFLYKPSREQLELSAQLINAGSGKVIAEKTFIYSIKTRYNKPYGGVVAANQAVKLMLQDLARFVVRHS